MNETSNLLDIDRSVKPAFPPSYESSIVQVPIVDQEYLEQQEIISEFMKTENSDYFRIIKNPNEELCWKALRKDINNIEFIKNANEEMCWFVIKKSSYHIRKIKNPTEDMILFCIELDPNSIKVCNNPTLKMWMVVKKKVSHAVISSLLKEIKIHNQTFSDFLVKSDITYFCDINDNVKTQELSEYVFNKLSTSLDDLNVLAYVPIKYQTYDLWKKVVDYRVGAVKYISDQAPFYYELCKYELNKNGLNITFMKNPSWDLCQIAINQNYDAWAYVLQKDGLFLKHCPRKTKELCKIAVQQNSKARKYVPFFL